MVVERSVGQRLDLQESSWRRNCKCWHM